MQKKETEEIVVDFGEDFGVIAKQDIGQMFVDIHASFTALDPLMVKDANINTDAY